MGRRSTVRIGCWAGAWGDTPAHARRLVEAGELDYLVGDHLAEVTMALLARARLRDPDSGHIPDVVDALAPLLPAIHERRVRVITNGGGLNPGRCRAALERAAAEAGVPLRVATVEGDDLLERVEELRAADRALAADLPEQPLSMNAYLGAQPIAAALAAGADIVVTGRCADSALVLGPLMHEFGWTDADHDLLAAGSLIGHVLECGTQATGGLFSDWRSVPGWEDMGPPIAECSDDGTATITKPPGTGGLVTTATVAEQIVYEIGDPGAYVLPDVICDWREVHVEQDGRDRVRIGGARGHAPTTTYKVTATHHDDFRLVSTVLVAGLEAGAKARRAGHAILARAERLAGEAGHEPFSETSLEVIGAGDTYGPAARDDHAREVVLKLAARHAQAEPLSILAREIAPAMLSMAPGMSGMLGGRARPVPALAVTSVPIEKALIPARIHIGSTSLDVAVGQGGSAARVQTATLEPPASAAPPDASDNVVPLRRIAHGRSGDKGNHANIGLLARRPEYLPILRDQVTPQRVRDFFAHHLAGEVLAWELPGLNAINFLLTDVLGGRGGTTSLRYDAQGKAYASMLLEMPVSVPAALLEAETGALETVA